MGEENLVSTINRCQRNISNLNSIPNHNFDNFVLYTYKDAEIISKIEKKEIKKYFRTYFQNNDIFYAEEFQSSKKFVLGLYFNRLLELKEEASNEKFNLNIFNPTMYHDKTMLSKLPHQSLKEIMGSNITNVSKKGILGATLNNVFGTSLYVSLENAATITGLNFEESMIVYGGMDNCEQKDIAIGDQSILCFDLNYFILKKVKNDSL